MNLHEAKTHLSDMVERASEGEEIVIAKAGVPRARLVPLARPVKERKPGAWKGRVVIGPDFDAPLLEGADVVPPGAPEAEGGWVGAIEEAALESQPLRAPARLRV